jgi:hypothetical protein
MAKAKRINSRHKKLCKTTNTAEKDIDRTFFFPLLGLRLFKKKTQNGAIHML